MDEQLLSFCLPSKKSVYVQIIILDISFFLSNHWYFLKQAQIADICMGVNLLHLLMPFLSDFFLRIKNGHAFFCILRHFLHILPFSHFWLHWQFCQRISKWAKGCWGSQTYSKGCKGSDGRLNLTELVSDIVSDTIGSWDIQTSKS